MSVSYHPLSPSLPLGSPPPGKGYKVAETNDPARVAKCMANYLWAGNVWKGGHRLRANFLHSDWCLLDIDDSFNEYRVEQAIKDFCDKIHIIGLTRNHRKDKHGIVLRPLPDCCPLGNQNHQAGSLRRQHALAAPAHTRARQKHTTWCAAVL